MFADDTTLSAIGKSTEDVVSNINMDLVSVVNWCHTNAMSIHESKSKAMILSTKPKLKDYKK